MIGEGLFDMPTGRRVDEPKMAIRVLPRVSAKALERARKTWPESQSGDFEREGKLFRDRATGTLFRRVPGDPGLGGSGREDVSVWFISADDLGDGIVYLIEADNPGAVHSVVQGEIGGRPAAPHEAMVR